LVHFYKLHKECHYLWVLCSEEKQPIGIIKNAEKLKIAHNRQLKMNGGSFCQYCDYEELSLNKNQP